MLAAPVHGPPPVLCPYPTDPALLPPEFRDLRHFVAWQWELRDGKWTKPPVCPHTGTHGDCSDPSTWGTFREAVAAARRRQLPGIGIELTEEMGIVGGDIDHCRDVLTGQIAPEALAIARRLNTLTFVSPTGRGLRFFLKGRIPGTRRRRGHIEVYSSGRYLTLTTERVPGTPDRIEARQAEFEAWYAEVFPPEPAAAPPAPRAPQPVDGDDETILARMFAASNGAAIRRLWDGDTASHGGNHSSADQALCNHLAFWTDRDKTRMDRLFRRSGLYREKWDRDDYRDGTIAKAIAAVHRGYAPSAPPSTNGHAGPTEKAPEALAEFACTDTGNAERLAAQHGPDLRHCRPFKRWYEYDGRRWAEDATGAIERRAKATVRGIYAEAAACNDKDKREALGKHAVRSESEAMRAAMIALAASEPGIPVLPDDLDADPWLLNVANGTLDLRSGILRRHRREDLITKLAPVEYQEGAKCPRWEAFLERVLPDPAVRRFVQRAAGHSLTGDVSERILPILHGLGRNGKSVFLETVRAALGDYATRTPAETLLVKRDGGIPNDVARLKGARFVTASETDDGRRLAEALVKELTGGDTISARFMRGEWFDFTPQFKLWLATNHKPVIRGTDAAIWDRIRLVPFTVRIPDAEQDRQLPAKLRAELPGILAWAVRGCMEWQAAGLGEPEAVTEATEEYRTDMDVLGDFLAERCVCAPGNAGLKVAAGALYAAYKVWCEAAGERPLTQKALAGGLAERGFEPLRAHGGARQWRGVGLAATVTHGDG